MSRYRKNNYIKYFISFIPQQFTSNYNIFVNKLQATLCKHL